MIILKNISKIYHPDIEAVKDVNLHIKPKEFVSIVGQSGTGKTTLLKMLIAEERPSKGKIIIGGGEVTNIKQLEVPSLRRQIGVVFQDFKLLPYKTVFENIAFAMHVCGAPPKRINGVIPQIL